MVIKRVDPFSAGKISGVICAAFGLLIGVVVAAVGMLGLGGSFGVAAIVLFPILYGVGGFLASCLYAVIYNVAAGSVGGIQIDVE